jgi:uncharacterized membrane protein YqjE
MALGQTLSRLGESLWLVASQRFELASLDVEEELARLCTLLAGTLITSLMLALALATAAATVVVYFWDSARLTALVALTAGFSATGFVMLWRLSRALRDKPRFMASTLAQLDLDRAPSGGAS